MVAYFLYYRFADHVLLDVEAGRTGTLTSALEKYVVMDDVYLEETSADWRHYFIQGPACADRVESWLGRQMPDRELRAEPFSWQGRSGWVIRRNWLGNQGVDLLLSASPGEEIRDELLVSGGRFGLHEVQEEAFHMLRLEAGVPQFGLDMDATNYPMEAGLDRAISLTKGCYVGQEVVSKATYIGGVGRRLVVLALETDGPVKPGSEVFSAQSRRIGQITSSAISPALGVTLAFAYVKREYAVDSTPVRIQLDEERAVAATVLPATWSAGQGNS
jgi:folate-binding protein YgfZ